MTSLIAANFFAAATAAVLGEASLEFLGLGNPTHGQLGDDALLGAEQQRPAHRAVDPDLRARPVHRRSSPPSLSLINFGVDALSNPRLRES